MRSRPSRYRYPMMIIGQAVWQYHRFNQSYRDVREQLLYRGIDVSHETIRSWCYKFSKDFEKVIKKNQRKVTDKWHLDEMTMKVNGEYFILWRAIDSEGYELDVFLQKRRNKKSAIRFLSRLLKSYPVPRVIVTDKLKSYIKPIKVMCRSTPYHADMWWAGFSSTIEGEFKRAITACLPLARGVQSAQENISGIDCEWLTPPGCEDAPVIYFLHGGAYIMGSRT